MGAPREVNLIRRKSVMDKIAAWIKENWADIVAFFDKLYSIIAEIIEG